MTLCRLQKARFLSFLNTLAFEIPVELDTRVHNESLPARLFY